MQVQPSPIESSLPRPWEVESNFQDHLYDWMQRAPWLALSAAAHMLVFFVLMSIPWDRFQQPPDGGVNARVPPPKPEDFIEVPIETPPEVPDTPVDPKDFEPQLVDNTIDPTDTPSEDDSAFDPTDTLSDPSPFPTDGLSGEIGIGGFAGGKYGNRGRGGRRGGGRGTERAVEDGLAWLAAHQSDEGSWDADGFASECGEIGSTTCEGEGYPTHDVGLTGLALLAFLGDGSSSNNGPHREIIARGLRWLHEQQDPDTGLIGDSSAHDFIYDHAIATLAICENLYFAKSPIMGRTAQRAVNYIVRARDPYGAWRYDVPSIGSADTSVTGWMVFALAAAKDAGVTVDPAAFEGALSWLDEVTDPATGRTGYHSYGSLSSRTTANEHFPREGGEAMTAVALLCRFFLEQTPEEEPIMERQAELLRRNPPEWNPEELGCDMYYWYYGSYAMFQIGGKHWRDWNESMKRALLPSQRQDGDAKGSWDPIGPWGRPGGRIYSTALMTLSLEVYYRYASGVAAR